MDEMIIAALTHGMDKEGALLSVVMPWPYWQSIKPEDSKAIAAWLTTLKRVSKAVVR